MFRGNAHVVHKAGLCRDARTLCGRSGAWPPAPCPCGYTVWRRDRAGGYTDRASRWRRLRRSLRSSGGTTKPACCKAWAMTTVMVIPARVAAASIWRKTSGDSRRTKASGRSGSATTVGVVAAGAAGCAVAGGTRSSCGPMAPSKASPRRMGVIGAKLDFDIGCSGTAAMGSHQPLLPALARLSDIRDSGDTKRLLLRQPRGPVPGAIRARQSHRSAVGPHRREPRRCALHPTSWRPGRPCDRTGCW